MQAVADGLESDLRKYDDMGHFQVGRRRRHGYIIDVEPDGCPVWPVCCCSGIDDADGDDEDAVNGGGIMTP